jgi:hypothetical protein
MFKKSIQSFIAILILLFVAGCASSSKAPKTFWINEEKAKGKSYKQLFIFAATLNIEARVRLENALAEQVVAKGLKVVKCKDVLPPALSDTTLPTKEILMKAIQASGSDGVFIITLLGKEEIVDYTPGKTAYGQTAIYNWNGGLFGYYSTYALTVNTRSTIEQEKQYTILSNFYDFASEELLLSVQSKIYEATNPDKTAEWYVRNVMAQMQNNHLINK